MAAAREVAIVTGAASGIGRATALRLAARGARLGLIDRDGEGLEATAKAIAAARCHVADVSDSRALAMAVRDIAQAEGGLDTVVNCAGIARETLVHETPEADWHDVIAVNLTGTFLLARHTLPWLLKRGRGAFVAISSDSGVWGAIGYGAYCASKHGVIGMIRCMALEYGSAGIRSNAVCPAFVATPMADAIFSRAPQGTRESFRNLVPLKRFAEADEVAKVVAHLSSDEASYTNGSVYMVDGGATAGYSVGS
ncbi:MAG: SDR family NAD(P)-dependent oxidoreductase [Alphaproteobacteria bacterium]